MHFVKLPLSKLSQLSQWSGEIFTDHNNLLPLLLCNRTDMVLIKQHPQGYKKIMSAFLQLCKRRKNCLKQSQDFNFKFNSQKPSWDLCEASLKRRNNSVQLVSKIIIMEIKLGNKNLLLLSTIGFSFLFVVSK